MARNRTRRAVGKRSWPRFLLAVAASGVVMAVAMPAAAVNQVSYPSSPLPPVAGVLLPDTPTSADAVFHRASLGFTFGNSCYASSANGPVSIVVDAVARTVTVDFDELQATLTPFCPQVYDPTSTMQLELSPLAPGIWTLHVDEMLTIFLPRPPVTLEFEVVPAGSAVPLGGRWLSALLAAAMLLVGILAMRPLASFPR